MEPFIRLVPWRKDAFSLQTQWQSLHKTAGTAFLQSSRASPPSRLPLPLSFLRPTFRAPDKLASGRGRAGGEAGDGLGGERWVAINVVATAFPNRTPSNVVIDSYQEALLFPHTNPRSKAKIDQLNSRLRRVRIQGNGRRATKTVTVRKVC